MIFGELYVCLQPVLSRKVTPPTSEAAAGAFSSIFSAFFFSGAFSPAANFALIPSSYLLVSSLDKIALLSF